MLTAAELDRRKPVWTALSEFWLDSELDEPDLERIAQVLANSEFSLAELRTIYLEEVAPVVWLNCWSVAGEWICFDEQWLHREARQNAERPNRYRRALRRTSGVRWLMTHAAEPHWRRLLTLLAGRSAPAS